MKCDVLIIGAGPAGLTASIFTLRAGLKTICVEKLFVGGQSALTSEISNYPGFDKISGIELSERMLKQAQDLGLELVYGEVVKLTNAKSNFVAELKNDTIIAKKVIIACGCKARHLGLLNEDSLIGKGVSFCASCDGHFFKNKSVAVVGGGNTAIYDVKYLSRIASKVYLIHRNDCFKANKLDVAKIKRLKNVEIITNATVTALKGKEQLNSITINQQGLERELQVDALFEAIGYEPELNFIDFDIKLDNAGYIVTDEDRKTSVKNCYASGDIVSKRIKQIVTACADGAIAGYSCIEG